MSSVACASAFPGSLVAQVADDKRSVSFLEGEPEVLRYFETLEALRATSDP